MQTLGEISTLTLAGILCTAFALGACTNTEPQLPVRNSPEGKALYEQCLKTLPPEKAAELKNLRSRFYPSEIVKGNQLLQECVKLQHPAP